MNQSIEIIKDLIIPFLQQKEKESLDNNWKNILNGFVAYDNNDQLLKNEINKLKLINENEIISVLPDLYDSFLDDLAEQFVIGNSPEASNKLFKDKNSLFIDKVNFYISLKDVITKMERKKIIDELQTENIISDKNLELAFKKKGREDLKEKFKKWSKELAYEKGERAVVASKPPNPPKGKLISLFSTRWAIAASIGLLITFVMFNKYNNSNIKYDIAEVQTSSFETKILTQPGMGFTDSETKNVVSVIFIDQKEKIASLEKITKGNKGESSHKKDLKILKKRDSKYTFVDNTLTIYSKIPEDKFQFIELKKEMIYIKSNNNFYKLKTTSLPLELENVNNDNIITQLEKIIFNNE